MGMRYLGPMRINYEQTGSFPTLEHQEDTWNHNGTSERRENHKLDDL